MAEMIKKKTRFLLLTVDNTQVRTYHSSVFAESMASLKMPQSIFGFFLNYFKLFLLVVYPEYSEL